MDPETAVKNKKYV